MLAAPNALMITGGPTTVMLAFEVLPVPALVEVTCVLLFFTPPVVPATFSETVQEAPGARLAPLKLTDDDPFTAVAVPEHVLAKLPGVATTSPAGRLSVNATPFKVRLALVLLKVSVRLVLPFSGIVAAPNAFAIVGGLMTVKLALDVDCAPVPAAVELIVTLLLSTPSDVPLAATVIVHAPTASEALLKETLPAPAAAVTVPPHVLVTAGTAATTRFDGKVSAKFASTAIVFGFAIAKLRVLVAFTATVVGLKLLVI